MMQWIKEYWFLIVFMSVAFGIYVEWRVSETTVAKVGEVAFVAPDELQALSREVEANAERIANNKEANDKLDSKIERIVDILLEP